MTGTIHKLLTLLGSVEVFAVSTMGGSGLAPAKVMLWLAAAGAITIFTANEIRRMWPDTQVTVTKLVAPDVTVAEDMSKADAPPTP